jgi:hypothetical protein
MAGRRAHRPRAARSWSGRGPAPAPGPSCRRRGSSRREDMPPDAADDRLEQPGRLADPIAQGGTVEIDALAGVDLALPIQRQVIAILRDQQMREHGGRGAAARRRHRRCRCLGDHIARLAGIFGPDMADHLEVARHVIQHLGHVLAQLAHAAAAGRADAGAVILRLMQISWRGRCSGSGLRFGFALTGGAGRSFGLGLGDILGLAGLQFLELQFQLLDLAGDPLRGRPNCIRRSLAIWNLSFSISSALSCTAVCAAFSSPWQASAKARRAAGSAGSSAVASDMPNLPNPPAEPESMRNR